MIRSRKFFLDDYYAIDSRLVRVSNEIHINDSFDFQSLGGSNDGAWLKSGAVFDDEFLLVRGDDAIGFDPVVRNILNANKFETSTFVSFEERLFWVNIIINASNIKNYIVFEADKAVLSSFKKSENLHLIVDDVSLKDDMLWSSDKLKAILKSKQYSGAYRVGDKDVYWIRSMAADNLFYFYN